MPTELCPQPLLPTELCPQPLSRVSALCARSWTASPPSRGLWISRTLGRRPSDAAKLLGTYSHVFSHNGANTHVQRHSLKQATRATVKTQEFTQREPSRLEGQAHEEHHEVEKEGGSSDMKDGSRRVSGERGRQPLEPRIIPFV